MYTSLWDFLMRYATYVLLLAPLIVMLYSLTRQLAKAPRSGKSFLQFLLIVLCMLLCFFVSGDLILVATWQNFLVSLVSVLVLFRLVYGVRGLYCLLATFELFVLLTLMELLCTSIFGIMSQLGVEAYLMVFSIEDIYHWQPMFIFLVRNTLPMALVLAGVSGWNAVVNHRQTMAKAVPKTHWLYALSILRLCALAVTALGALILPYMLLKTNPSSQTVDSKQYVILAFSAAGLACVGFSYVVQDMRYIMQLQRLNTLEHQQAISRSLLQNLRFFRHNMVNMLYGLEGVLIGGDREQVSEYYRQMQEKCALVNNENIAALERVTSPSVASVLLHGVDRARQLTLPINLYVQEKVFFDGFMRDADLCQVIGVLVDNAIEAADKAEERFVSIEIRDVESAVEIIIKNTYAGEIDPRSLTTGGASSKAGHSGEGLLSCYHTLGKYKGTFLNFWVTGQYVQAQLLLSR